MKAVILEFLEGTVALPVTEIARVLRPEEVDDLKQNGVGFSSLAELFHWTVSKDAPKDGLLIPNKKGMPQAFGDLVVGGIVELEIQGANRLPPFSFHDGRLSARALPGDRPVFLFSCPTLIEVCQ